MFKLVTPADPIVTTAIAKTHLSVEHGEDDVLIDKMVSAATRYIERQTARQFGQATWKLFLDGFPSGVIELRRCPVIAVTEVKYYDPDVQPQTIADFQLDAVSEPARLAPAVGASWPQTSHRLNSVEVTFTAGYTTIPEEARQCILLLIGHWYANREGVVTGTISKPIEFAIEALRDSLKWTL